MKKTIIKKIINWVGVSSLAAVTIGLPLLFIGGAGQEVSKVGVNKVSISAINQPPNFFPPEGQPRPSANEVAGQNQLNEIVDAINVQYSIISSEIANSGFFETKSLSPTIETAIENIGTQLFIISDSRDANTYILNSSLFSVASQLNLIVRIDTSTIESRIIENILQKNVDDNANLAISGSVIFAIGGFGMIAAFGLYMYHKSLPEDLVETKKSVEK